MCIVISHEYTILLRWQMKIFLPIICFKSNVATKSWSSRNALCISCLLYQVPTLSFVLICHLGIALFIPTRAKILTRGILQMLCIIYSLEEWCLEITSWEEVGDGGATSFVLYSKKKYTLDKFYSGLCFQERPYQSDSTASRLLSEVKHFRARLVLRWGTTLESLVLIFCFYLLLRWFWSEAALIVYHI